jgi:beta-glucosidase
VSADVAFPAGFLWGAATSSHQVEGGNDGNDWWDWEAAGRVARGETSGNAAEWWTGRAEEDLKRAADMGHNAHRMSLEWSRLEPQPGHWNDAAFERYRAIVGTMRDLGLTPSVTLHHFTLPRWAARAGGWKNRGIVERFAWFARVCARRLADLVDMWATINEPTILLYKAYNERSWPPAGSPRDAPRVLANLLRAHCAACIAVKEEQPDAHIGIVLNLPAIDPARPDNLLDRAVSRVQDGLFNGQVLRALAHGILHAPLSFTREHLPGDPNVADWYGLNYYGRHRMRFTPSSPLTLFGREVQHEVAEVSTTWGDPHPQGLTRHLLRIATLGRPVYVTENGINDASDSVRPRYLANHVGAVRDAIAAGADVRGYFHWSLIDNFEWAEGWAPRFGLIALDRETQERKVRGSAEVYAAIIREAS